MNKILLVFIISLYSVLSFSQADQKVADLLNNEDFLELRRVYPTLKDSLYYPMLGALSEASIRLAFDNDPQTKIEAIGLLINKHGAELGAENVAGFIGFLSLELVKQGKGDEALQVLKQLIAVNTDRAILEGIKNNYNIVSGLKEIHQSKVVRDQTISNKVSLLTNTIGSDRLWYVPVEMNGVVEPFIFDTGAAASFVSKNFAEKHDIRVVADSILMGGVGGHDYTSLGVIDTIKIGNILYLNMPVYIGNTDYPKDSITVEAVLGVPFMQDVGAIKIEPKANEITFLGNAQSDDCNLSNVSLSGNRMLMEVYSENQRLLMFCDTGAAMSGHINANIHKNNPELLRNVESESDSTLVRGFAGSTYLKRQRIPKVELKVGDEKKSFTGFQLVDQSICDGELGVGFFKQCEVIIIDLNERYLRIE